MLTLDDIICDVIMLFVSRHDKINE